MSTEHVLYRVLERRTTGVGVMDYWVEVATFEVDRDIKHSYDDLCEIAYDVSSFRCRAGKTYRIAYGMGYGPSQIVCEYYCSLAGWSR